MDEFVDISTLEAAALQHLKFHGDTPLMGIVSHWWDLYPQETKGDLSLFQNPKDSHPDVGGLRFLPEAEDLGASSQFALCDRGGHARRAGKKGQKAREKAAWKADAKAEGAPVR